MEPHRRPTKKRSINKRSGKAETRSHHCEKLSIKLPMFFLQMQISMFDESLGIIAASRVLLGQLFWRSHDNDAALRELEPSCPILWDYDVEKISLDNDVSALQYLHIHSGKSFLSRTCNFSNRVGWTATPH